MLGICNGLQVLIKSGVLLADDAQGPPATLTWNESGRYEDRWVQLAVSGNKCVFLRGLSRCICRWRMPKANLWPATPRRSLSLEDAGQLVLRYATATSGLATAFPENPNVRRPAWPAFVTRPAACRP